MGVRGPNGSGGGLPTHWDLVRPLGSEKTARIIFSLELNAAAAHRHDHLGGHTAAPCCYSVSFRGVCVTYGETLLLAVSKPSSYGKMVPLRHPMVKQYPPQGSYNSKIGEGGEVTW